LPFMSSLTLLVLLLEAIIHNCCTPSASSCSET
jgi:hypothetical protein